MRTKISVCKRATWGFVLFFVTCSLGWKQPAIPRSKNHDEKPRARLLLTFDDGPHETRTPAILAIMAEHNIRGIFFWVGRQVHRSSRSAAKRASIVQNAVQAGHLVANHTLTHPHLCRILKQKAEQEIDRNRIIFENLSQMPVPLFRAPYGNDCSRLRKQLRKRKTTHMHWDIDPQEWVHNDTFRTLAYLKRKIKNLKGDSIVLMHDTKSASLQALPQLLSWIQTENIRRKRAGKPVIEFIEPSSLIAQQHELGLLRWSVTAITESFRPTKAHNSVVSAR